MNNLPQSRDPAFLLKFDGKMTYAFHQELEEKVIDAMRRYSRLELDLSEVTEIDPCGLHLVGLLLSGGVIVATSNVVEQATKSLLGSLHSAVLGRLNRNDRPAADHQRRALAEFRKSDAALLDKSGRMQAIACTERQMPA